jgi:glutamyl-tRNA(Gln) amidotransferase subunit E
MEEIAIRAREACDGVPLETRQAHDDGTNGFERILPGADRMYPDTDLPPIDITDERINRIQAQLPEPPWDREKRYRADGLSEQIAYRMSISKRADLFDRLSKTADKKVLAAAIVQHIPALTRKGLDTTNLDAVIEEAFKLLSEGRILRDAIPILLWTHLTDGGSPADLVKELGLKPAKDKEIAEALDSAAKETAARKFKKPEAVVRFAMGVVMKRLRGRVDGQGLETKLKERFAAEALI